MSLNFKEGLGFENKLLLFFFFLISPTFDLSRDCIKSGSYGNTVITHFS